MKQFFSCYLDDVVTPGRSLDIFAPETEKFQEFALFFVHGGGWSSGSKSVYHRIMEKFNQHGFICASTDYRLASPVRKAPGAGITALDQLQDIREAYDIFVSFLKDRGALRKIAVFGSSAGAHLASLLSCAAPGECGESAVLKNPWMKPEKLILQSVPVSLEPWEDIFPPIQASIADCACGWSYEENPEIFRKLSMSSYLGRNNPQCFFMEAGNEHMFPGEFSLEAAKKHRQWQINSIWKKYPSAEHGFFYDTTRKIQQTAFADILDFLSDQAISGAAEL